jgi:hypothetical protein
MRQREKRTLRMRTGEERALEISRAQAILREDKKPKAEPVKHPGAEKFLPLFSFLPFNTEDEKYTALYTRWRCRSFNEHKQYLEFFKTFVYPYYVPEPLIFTALQQEHILNAAGRQCCSPDQDIIKVSKKWLKDITAGGSFYKRNKDYFTKAEAHYFLSSRAAYIDSDSIIKEFFEAKCKARHFSDSLCSVVAGVFTVKFRKYFNHDIVKGFLDLISRYAAYPHTRDELGDICDFVLAKIVRYEKFKERELPFSFGGRTISSVILLSNEWHADQQREEAIRTVLDNAVQAERRQDRTGQAACKERWQGIRVPNFKFEDSEHIWTIVQLCSVQELVHEGRTMKHCVASYIKKCSLGECGIFNVSSRNKTTAAVISRATIEVLPNRTIIQAKGKCNTIISYETMNVITRWAQQNRLRTGM